MGILDRLGTLRNWFYAPLLAALEGLSYDELREMGKRREYRRGKQDKQLKVRDGQFDDNITLNFAGLVIDRSVSLLFGDGIEFDLPGDEETPESEYIRDVWDANKQEILLHKLAVLGGEQGTCYLKLIPDGTAGRDGTLLPRLMYVDPAWMTIRTNPEDAEEVQRYRIEYVYEDENGNERARRQDIEKQYRAIQEGDEITGFEATGWTITDYRTDAGGKWEQIGQEAWPYDFPPMIHWQNLPNPTDVYGEPDITDDVLELQDRTNFLASNISKIVRLYAHPMRYGSGITSAADITAGPGDMLLLPVEGAKIEQLEPAGDLASSQQFLLTMRQALFDITQTVDISSMSDKLGALTNFGLRVLYRDALAKLSVKRELYGDALLEINYRLLVLGDFANTDPGSIVWKDPLPKNEQEQITTDQFELDAGLASKQTIALRRGLSWETEQERMAEEGAAAGNIGELLLRNFNAGGGGVA